jgi:hypothetical protein
VCIQIEFCSESERERETRGRDSVSGPQKSKRRKDLCLTRVFDENVHPLLFGYMCINLIFLKFFSRIYLVILVKEIIFKTIVLKEQ